MKPRTLILLVVILAACVCRVRGDEWKTFESNEGNFKAVFPGQPMHQVQDLKTDAGPLKLHMHVVGTDEDRTGFVVAYCDYPDDHVKAIGAKTILDNCAKGVAAAYGSEVAALREIKLDGSPGRQFTFRGKWNGQDVIGQWRIFLVGNRQYQIGVFSMTVPFAEDVAKFLPSFERLKK